MRCCGYICVAEDSGYGRDIDAIFNRSRSEGMAKCVELDVLQAKLLQQLGEIVLQVIGIQHTSFCAKEDKVFRGGQAVFPYEASLLFLQNLTQHRRHH